MKLKESFRVLTLMACGFAMSCSQGKNPAASQIVIVGSGESPFPSESLTDWVSYAFQVAEVTVISEEEIPPPQQVLDNKEGYIGRKVRLAIGDNLWVNQDGFAPATGEIDVIVAGWILKGDRKIRFAMRNSPRLEVGGKYVIPLLQMPRATASDIQWGPISTDAVMAAPDSAIAKADADATVQGQSLLVRRFDGRPLSVLQQALANTPMDPIAAKYRKLPPLERVHAVRAEKH